MHRWTAGAAILAACLLPAGEPARAQAPGKVWMLHEVKAPAYVDKIGERRFTYEFVGTPGVEGVASMEVDVPARIDPDPIPFNLGFRAMSRVRLGAMFESDRRVYLRVKAEVLCNGSTACWVLPGLPEASDARAASAGGNLLVSKSTEDLDPPLHGPFEPEDRPIIIRFNLTTGPATGPDGSYRGGAQSFAVDALYFKVPPPEPDIKVEGQPVFVQTTDARGVYGELGAQSDLPLVKKRFGVRALITANQPTAAFAVSASFSDAAIPQKTTYYLADDLDRYWRLRGPFATLAFDRAGSKAIYFFPNTENMSSNATLAVKVTVNADNVVREADKTNNSGTTMTSVVTQKWDGGGGQLRVRFTRINSAQADGCGMGAHNAFFFLSASAEQLMPAEDLYFEVGSWDGDTDSISPPGRLSGVQFLTLARSVLKQGRIDDPQAARVVGLRRLAWFRDKVPIALTTRESGVAFPLTPLGRLVLAPCEGGMVAQIIPFLNSYGIPSLSPALGQRHVTDGVSVSERLPTKTGALNDQSRTLVVYDVMGLAGMSNEAVLAPWTAPYGSWITGRDYWMLLCGWTSASCGKQAKPPAGALAPANRLAQVTDGVLVVSGAVGRQGGGRLEPAYRRPEGVVDASVGGDYALALVDGSGRDLAAATFAVDWSLVDQLGATEMPFALALPWRPSAARLVLRRGPTELATSPVSANAPRVRVTSPNGGESLSGTHTITWTGDDPDGDRLAYLVQYSRDGGATWTTLAGDIAESRLEWDTGLAAGGGRSLVRVLATDGVNTAEDVSDGTFTVSDKAPRAAIYGPPDGAVFDSAGPVVLRGGGADPEDGALAGAALAWTSDRDGALGTGAAVTRTLSAGSHRITLSARDGRGQAGTDARSYTVASGSSPDVWLSSADLSVAPAAPLEWSTVLLQAVVHANGPDAACTVFAHDGDPRAGGVAIGDTTVAPSANEPGIALIEWQPRGRGPHTVHMRVSGCRPAESNTSNNWATLDVAVAEGRRLAVYLPLLARDYDPGWPFYDTAPTVVPPPTPTPGGGPGPTLTPIATGTLPGPGTPGTPQTPATPNSPTPDRLGTAVAATLTALVPRDTPSPGPTLGSPTAASTTATPTPSPTLTAPPTPTETPPPGGDVAVSRVWTTDDQGRPRTAFGPGDEVQLWAEVVSGAGRALPARLSWLVAGEENGLFIANLSDDRSITAPAGASEHSLRGTVLPATPWGPYVALATLNVDGRETTAEAHLFITTDRGWYDDFSSAASGWAIADTADHRFGYFAGDYGILVRPSNLGYFVRSPRPERRSQGLVEVDVRRSEDTEGTVGLVAKPASEADSTMNFLIHSRGHFTVYRYTPGLGVTEHVPWTASSVVVPGTARNHLMVVRRQDNWAFYVNGSILARVHDATLPAATRPALIVFSAAEPNVEARWDNYREYGLSP